MPEDRLYLAETREPNRLELTERDSYYYPESQLVPYNPDDLVQKFVDYSLYDEMLRDDQVSVAMQLKKDLVLCSGFDILPEGDDQDEIVNDLNIALSEDPDWPFENMLEEIISSFEYGFSLSEKIFTYRDDGSLTLKAIKTRHPGSWEIETDKQGNIAEYRQIGTKSGTIVIPPENLIHFINRRKFQNPYGISDLRAAHQAWVTKKHVTRWYAIFIERAAGPIPVGKYPEGLDKTRRTDLYNAIKKFQTKSALVIPKDVEVEFLNAQNDGQAFIRGINLMNMFIGRSLLIPDLLGFQGSETSGGAYSLGAAQMEIFYKHIKRRRDFLEKTINNEIVWPIVLHNWGFVDNYPKFKLRPINNEEIFNSAKLWIEAVRSGVKLTPEDISHFKSIINFPDVADAVAEDMPSEPIDPQGKPEVILDETEDGDETAIDKEGQHPDKDEMPPKEMPMLQAKARKFDPPTGLYADKVDIDAIETSLDEALNTFLALSKMAVAEIFDEFSDLIERKKIVQNVKVEKIDSLKLNKTASLRQKLHRALMNMFIKSKQLAAGELFKGSFAKPLPDETFERLLAEENFNWIKDWEFAIKKKTRIAIVAAIKDGKSVAAVIEEVQGDIKNKANVNVETYARTKFTEVMNKGRISFFDESKVVQGYQYSAVMDDVTTEICRGLNNKKFLKGTEPIPPLHFNATIEGTLIESENGTKPIETIKVGEMVKTHQGRYCRVYDTMSKFEDKEYFEIELDNGKTLSITGEHPVLSARGWIRADELLMTDNIVCLEDIKNV